MMTTIPEEQRTHCEVWTRVMGYHRPVSQFNKGKQGEYQERRYFRQPRFLSPLLSTC